jgi:hypothetical protein
MTGAFTAMMQPKIPDGSCGLAIAQRHDVCQRTPPSLLRSLSLFLSETKALDGHCAAPFLPETLVSPREKHLDES